MIKYTDSNNKVKYKGIMVDILDKVAEIANFEYTIYITPGSVFGWKVNDTHWSGMLGEVQSKVIFNDGMYMYRNLLNNKVKGVKPS